MRHDAVAERAAAAQAPPLPALRGLGALRSHWPEYAMEAAGLGAFMVSACVFGVWFFHLDSSAAQFLHAHALQNVAMGAAMGLTAMGIIYSPWGRRSGAHINPAVTLTFWRLHKIHGADALFYAAFQFAGAVAGVLLAATALRDRIGHPSVNYVVTMPGASVGLAFVTEFLMAFGLMALVLTATNTPRLARLTGVLAGMLVASYIALLAPLSGMSINPARSFGSALVASVWPEFWIYLVAPPAAMLVAAELFVRRRAAHAVICAKFVHDRTSRCIFRCGYAQLDHPEPGVRP